MIFCRILLFFCFLWTSSASLAQLQVSGFDVGSASSTKIATSNLARYVVSGSLPSGVNNSLTINDAIPSGSHYVPGSLRAPSGATRQWSVDGGSNYVSVEPVPASSVTNLRIQNTAATIDASSLTTIPPLPAAAISGGNTGGTVTVSYPTTIRFIPFIIILVARCCIAPMQSPRTPALAIR